MRVILFMLTMLVTAAVYAGDKTNAPAMKSFYIRGKVVQVLDDGILIEGSRFSSEDWQHLISLIKNFKAMEKKAEAMPDSSPGPVNVDNMNNAISSKLDAEQKAISLGEYVKKFDEEMGTKGTYFVTGITDSLADGEKWKGTVYYVDLYSCISVSGAKKTVRHYSTSPQ